MTQDELLQTLLQKLDEPVARYAELERYYTGTQPLAFLSPGGQGRAGQPVRPDGKQSAAPGDHVACRAATHHRVHR